MREHATVIDPAIAKQVVDQRWPDDAGLMARNSIRDEEFVSSQVDLARSGSTHDERIVELYYELGG